MNLSAGTFAGPTSRSPILSMKPTQPLPIRQAVLDDAHAPPAIYRPFVESTAVSFETIVLTAEGFAARIAKALALLAAYTCSFSESSPSGDSAMPLQALLSRMRVASRCTEALASNPLASSRPLGRKFGPWHDVAWFQRALRDAPRFE